MEDITTRKETGILKFKYILYYCGYQIVLLQQRSWLIQFWLLIIWNTSNENMPWSFFFQSSWPKHIRIFFSAYAILHHVHSAAASEQSYCIWLIPIFWYPLPSYPMICLASGISTSTLCSSFYLGFQWRYYVSSFLTNTLPTMLAHTISMLFWWGEYNSMPITGLRCVQYTEEKFFPMVTAIL